MATKQYKMPKQKELKLPKNKEARKPGVSKVKQEKKK